MRYTTYRDILLIALPVLLILLSALFAWAISWEVGVAWGLITAALVIPLLWLRLKLTSAQLDDYGGRAPLGGSLIFDVTDDREPPEGPAAGPMFRSPGSPPSARGSGTQGSSGPDASGTAEPPPRPACTNCHATVVEPDARFCDNCGWPLTSPPRAVVPPPPPRRCIACQTVVVRPGAEYCYACGEPVPAVPGAPVPAGIATPPR